MTLKLLATALLLILAALGIWHSVKPLPAGLGYRGEPRFLHEPELLTDTTRHFPDGHTEPEHEIFDEIFRLIGQAEQFILVDMFLFNSSRPESSQLRPLAEQTAQALIARKQLKPNLDIVVITDPINTFYGGTRSPHFEAMERAGIQVVITSLEPLRDSNPVWSSIWRLCCQWLGNNPDGGWLPNALGDQPATLRSYLALPNFKANHRKVLVADSGTGFRAVVTSANPHDGSSRHSNVALAFGGRAVADVVRSEQAVARLSGADTRVLDHWISHMDALPEPEPGSDNQLQLLTESAIRDKALAMIRQSNAGDRLDIAMFYLSHRNIITALKDARERGADVRLLLDANKDAFGHEKNGIPNRPVANELHRAGVDIRWCNTRGEQCHTKLVILQPDTGPTQLLLGSANFTRRNLDDLNLESNVWLQVPAGHPVAIKARSFFDEHWQNGPGSDQVLSLPWSEWADASSLRYWQYRLMEATGLSTF